MTEGRRPTAYIHVGPYKTGSSSLKHFIRGNLATLEDCGLFFPMLRDRSGKPARNHMELATCNEIRPDGELKPKAQLWPEIQEVAKKGEKNILLSSEMFSRSLADPQALDRVLAFFDARGYRVVVLAYVRDQPAWLNSWYVHSQRRFAGLMTFDEFVEEADRRGRVEPLRYLKTYIDEPRVELEAIPFERAAAVGLEDDFIRRCGIPPDAPLVRTSLRNPNAGAKTVFAAQEVMRRIGDEGLQDLPGFAPVCNGFKRRYVRLGWEATPHVALTEENVACIRARYAESNETFARRFFAMSWAELCPAKPFRTSVFDPADASWWERRRIERLVRETAEKFEQLKRASKAGRRAQVA